MRRMLLAAVAAGALLAAGYSLYAGSSRSGTGSPSAGGTGPAAPAVTLRLGFVADVAQAAALVGIRDGLFARNLGPGVALRLAPFRTDTAEAAALAAGKLDAAYASPMTILAADSASAGSISIISGAASGGGDLVVRTGTTAAALRGRTLAVPAVGGPQDIALRSWLARHHLLATAGGGVKIVPLAPAAALTAFRSGQIQGALEPAPYDAEMASHGGRILATGAGLWPGGQVATANLIVTHRFLDAHSGTILGLLKGQVQANDLLRHDLIAAALAASGALAAQRAGLPSSVLTSSLFQVGYTDDPIAASLISLAQHAAAAGLPVPHGDLLMLYDLAPLNLVLRAAGEQPVSP